MLPSVRLLALSVEQTPQAKFIVSDEHTNIRACALPEWLPGDHDGYGVQP